MAGLKKRFNRHVNLEGVEAARRTRRFSTPVVSPSLVHVCDSPVVLKIDFTILPSRCCIVCAAGSHAGCVDVCKGYVSRQSSDIPQCLLLRDHLWPDSP